MKKIIATTIVLLFMGKLIAHYGEAHQHLVREAYNLLKYQLGCDITEMVNHIGNNEIGTHYFDPGGLVVIGAYREDLEDIVYRLCGVTIPLIWDDCKYVNCTH